VIARRPSEEEQEVRKRLARLEAADPSQKRPPKVPCIWDVVDFMVWDTWRDLGLLPPAGKHC